MLVREVCKNNKNNMVTPKSPIRLRFYQLPEKNISFEITNKR